VPSDPLTPNDTRALANGASEAIRALNHATLPADDHPGLKYPSDAYDLLSALYELSGHLPQLLEQISAFLLREVQFDVVAIDGGTFVGRQATSSKDPPPQRRVISRAPSTAPAKPSHSPAPLSEARPGPDTYRWSDGSRRMAPCTRSGMRAQPGLPCLEIALATSTAPRRRPAGPSIAPVAGQSVRRHGATGDERRGVNATAKERPKSPTPCPSS
jgi:hypothetical protein